MCRNLLPTVPLVNNTKVLWHRSLWSTKHHTTSPGSRYTRTLPFVELIALLSCEERLHHKQNVVEKALSTTHVIARVKQLHVEHAYVNTQVAYYVVTLERHLFVASSKTIQRMDYQRITWLH